MSNMKKLVIANWKMNPQTSAEAESMFSDIKKIGVKLKKTHAVVCPPDIFLGDLQAVYSGEKVSLGAQDVFWKKKGSYTGEVSVDQLKDSDVKYVLVGHSERRALGETNEEVQMKLEAVVEAGMTPVLCVGEIERDDHGDYLSFITEELKSALLNISEKKIKNVIVAYEPIWAIGKDGDDAMSPHDMHQMSLFIRKILLSMFQKKAASSVSVIYGGSVERDNAEDLMRGGEVNGFLVGHASLDAKHFSDILNIVEKI